MSEFMIEFVTINPVCVRIIERKKMRIQALTDTKLGGWKNEHTGSKFGGGGKSYDIREGKELPYVDAFVREN